MTMKIYKALVGLDADDGNLYEAHVIEHEAKFWLVSGWLEAPSEGYKIPARLVSMDGLPQQVDLSADPAFLLTQVPKSFFDLGSTPAAGTAFLDRPDIRFSIPKGVH